MYCLDIILFLLSHETHLPKLALEFSVGISQLCELIEFLHLKQQIDIKVNIYINNMEFLIVRVIV